MIASTIPLAGTADLDPGALLGTSPSPLLRVVLKAVLSDASAPSLRPHDFDAHHPSVPGPVSLFLPIHMCQRLSRRFRVRGPCCTSAGSNRRHGPRPTRHFLRASPITHQWQRTALLFGGSPRLIHGRP